MNGHENLNYNAKKSLKQFAEFFAFRQSIKSKKTSYFEKR